MSNSNPQVAYNMKKMEELNQPLSQHTQFDMMKFLETYKRGVDYYNAYGLNSAANSTRDSRQNTQRLSTGASSFWDNN